MFPSAAVQLYLPSVLLQLPIIIQARALPCSLELVSPVHCWLQCHYGGMMNQNRKLLHVLLLDEKKSFMYMHRLSLQGSLITYQKKNPKNILSRALHTKKMTSEEVFTSKRIFRNLYHTPHQTDTNFEKYKGKKTQLSFKL